MRVRDVLALAVIGIVLPAVLQAQEATAQSRSVEQEVRPQLETQFARIDELQISEGPAGPQGNFFLSGDLTRREPLAAAQAQDAAAAAVESIAELLEIDLATFSPDKVRESVDPYGVTHRRYRMTLDGWRVELFEVLTHVRGDGTLIGANGHVVRFGLTELAEIRAALQEETIPEVEAKAAVLEALTGIPEGAPKLERVITQDAPYLFWSVLVSTRDPLGSWQYYVDAQSGAIVKKVSLLQSAR